jgi:hypothetical protein
MVMTSEQRRAYIDTNRRCQPIDELFRKAKKAQRKGWRVCFAGTEGIDLGFAEDWRWRRKQNFSETFKRTYCSLCSTFAEQPGGIVMHKTRCSANPVDDGPYPGWSSSGKRMEERSVEAAFTR